MQEYQKQYIENLKEIEQLSDFYSVERSDYSAWVKTQMDHQLRIRELKAQNLRLLSDHLFVTLDALHDATEEEIKELEEFSDALMDWMTNLDSGIYIMIHDSLLSLYRYKKDRNNIIKELYKLGMGMYYQNRSIEGIRRELCSPFYFRNEMVFTEASGYLKYFAQIEDSDTKGYIIRSLANIGITLPRNLKKKIAVANRVIAITKDDHYRSLAPELPWDVFQRRTYQQLSACREVLDRGNLTTEELSSVLEACHIVFEPEKDNQNPNIRWLWPYYEMEYTCGFADIYTTLDRMEKIIDSVPYNTYDMSGLYANVQLAIYYGTMLKRNPNIRNREKHVQFLNHAYEKMMQTMLTFPACTLNDFLAYNTALVLTDYYECEGVPTFQDITLKLMPHLSGQLYLNSLKAAELMRYFAEVIYDHDPTFFDDIPFLKTIGDLKEKRHALSDYAYECGLYHDFGLIKLNMQRIVNMRGYLDSEYEIYQLHTSVGHDELYEHASTRRFADICHGHHNFYDGSEGFSKDYIRNQSDYRQMTDLMAVVSYLIDHYDNNLSELIKEILIMEHRQFSPLICAYLLDEDVIRGLQKVLDTPEENYYLQIYESL